MPRLFLSTENKEKVNMSHCFSIRLPSALQRGMFSKLRHSLRLAEKHRVSPPWNPASSSIISCVLFTNPHHRQLLDYIELGKKKKKKVNWIHFTRQKLFSGHLRHCGKTFRNLGNKTRSAGNLAWLEEGQSGTLLKQSSKGPHLKLCLQKNTSAFLSGGKGPSLCMSQ